MKTPRQILISKIKALAVRFGSNFDDVTGKEDRSVAVIEARRSVLRAIVADDPNISLRTLATVFGRDRTTIRYYIDGKKRATSILPSVMQSRSTPSLGLDYFPTPPWATRAFLREIFIPRSGLNRGDSAWDPAVGEGHMFHVLKELFVDVHGSDVHDYGKGFEIGSYVGVGPDVAPRRSVDWIITNPPFNLGQQFIERALSEASVGVAMLLRTSFVEGAERYEALFGSTPPYLIAQYCDRVPMVAGVWDPDASTATSYAWFVWLKDVIVHDPKWVWIKPGARARNWSRADVVRWIVGHETTDSSHADLLDQTGSR